MAVFPLPTKRSIIGAILVGLMVLGMFAFIGTANAQTTDGQVCTTVVVVDQEAYTEVIPGTDGQHYSYVGGPIEGTPAPPPAEGWQANTAIEPHYQGNATPAQQPDGDPYTDGEFGLHYTSHGNSGLADWFYFQPGTPGQTIEHPAVTHEETTCVTPTPPPPTEPPPTEEPPVEPPHEQWTPTWTPTWEPTWEPKPEEEYPPLAHTGGELTFAGIALGLAALGSAALWYARKLSKE
jgi:LPXTG-motif cell wall-anchored protein